MAKMASNKVQPIIVIEASEIPNVPQDEGIPDQDLVHAIQASEVNERSTHVNEDVDVDQTEDTIQPKSGRKRRETYVQHANST